MMVQPKVVLIAEDDDLIRGIVADFMTAEGYVLLSVANAAQALEVLRESSARPNLLFTDVQMPGPINGIELAHLAAVNWPRMKIIITSGEVTPTAEEIPPGSRFIPKPYSIAMLRDEISGVFVEVGGRSALCRDNDLSMVPLGYH